MELWYASRTGKVERIVSKLGFRDVHKILSGEEKASDEYVLFTYTDGYGEIPLIVDSFLSRNFHLLRGVAGSGNRNFGRNFCRSVELIHERYKVPILMKFDLGGNEESIEELRNILINLSLR
ncbi:ribonucleoprotein [Candidatus Mycoplasma haematolamae str. Purdue]|uniref:Ribonucleoprotein n=1 Tax=Mycoplasma haematolamae (strain Purdue) TaxID=1212765 RepID=I7BIS7_MYCHA|nr:class Ib ribonucleoside-diphosphate reductase assembly flavoprotein NrdI [Candidatus Mycoplasma haematolamae]AFO51728.1 ribonucleoprotein [Candidatus Mycoplasma haematolamae str. Purdue]